MRSWSLLPLLLLAGTSAHAADEIALFNGKDFTGWTFFLEEKDFNADGNGKISDFAKVLPGGVMEINPKLHGALMTERDYLNFRLRVEYRWVDPKARNNSGLFLRIRPPYVWGDAHGESARYYMAQMGPGTTGDLWVLGNAEGTLVTDPGRSFWPFGTRAPGRAWQIRQHVRSKEAEKPAGEWNSYEVEMVGKVARVWLNGELVNEGINLVDLPGRIGLESEFGPIQFRNIRLTPIADDAPPPQVSVKPVNPMQPVPPLQGQTSPAAAAPARNPN